MNIHCLKVLAPICSAILIATTTGCVSSAKPEISQAQNVAAFESASLPSGEILAKRTQTSKTYYLFSDNRYVLDCSIGAVHYQDTQGNWQNINNTFTPAQAPWNWQMVNDSYQTYVLNNLTAGQVLKFTCEGESVAFQPMALEWTNSLNQIQQISMPVNVPPVLSSPTASLLPNVFDSLGTIKWVGGYGAGRNFSWQNTPGRLNKILEIVAKSNLPTPASYIISGGNPALRLNFIFAPSSSMTVYVDGQLWDAKTKKQTVNLIQFKKNSTTLWDFLPVRCWDSSDNNSITGITELSKAGNNLYVSALIPYSWLQTATYPIYIDPTITPDPIIGASADDAYEILDGTMDINGATVRCYSSATNPYRMGLRFISAEFPTSGVTVDVCYFTIICSSTSYDDANLNIYLQLATTPATFTANAFDISSRTKTTASVAWVSSGLGTNRTNSSNISGVGSPAQELWDSYSPTAVAVICYGKTDISKALRIVSYDSSTTNCATFHIEWTAAGGEEPAEPAFVPRITIW